MKQKDSLQFIEENKQIGKFVFSSYIFFLLFFIAKIFQSNFNLMNWKLVHFVQKSNEANKNGQQIKKKSRNRYTPLTKAVSEISNESRFSVQKPLDNSTQFSDEPFYAKQFMPVQMFENFRKEVMKALKDMKSFCTKIKNQLKHMQKFYTSFAVDICSEVEKMAKQTSSNYQQIIVQLNERLTKSFKNLKGVKLNPEEIALKYKLSGFEKKNFPPSSGSTIEIGENIESLEKLKNEPDSYTFRQYLRKCKTPKATFEKKFEFT